MSYVSQESARACVRACSFFAWAIPKGLLMVTSPRPLSPTYFHDHFSPIIPLAPSFSLSQREKSILFVRNGVNKAGCLDQI